VIDNIGIMVQCEVCRATITHFSESGGWLEALREVKEKGWQLTLIAGGKGRCPDHQQTKSKRKRR
jgi:hypothetical protein